jgi:hypothetical protein
VFPNLLERRLSMDSTENTDTSPVPETSPVVFDPEAPQQRSATGLILGGVTSGLVGAGTTYFLNAVAGGKDDPPPPPQTQVNVEHMNVTINNGTPDE